MQTPAAAALAALVITLGGAAFGHYRYVAGQESVQAKWDAATLAAQKVVIQKQKDVAVQDRDAQVKTQKAQDHASDQTHTLDRTVVGLVAERDRLRHDLDTIRANALPSTQDRARLAAQTGALANSLSECSDRYSALAAERDELAIQLGGLLTIVD